MFLFYKNDKRALNSGSTVILYKLRFYWRSVYIKHKISCLIKVILNRVYSLFLA